jgi:flagellar motor protein MotB
MSRATTAAATLAQNLAKLSPDEYATAEEQIWEDGDAHTPYGSFIRAKGFGASQRLPGYDDGGNYDQNRRVEVTLVVEEKEAANAYHQ